MQPRQKKLFISTAIDYVNAPAHLGHALEKVQADVIARYHRILGENVFFLTGTDENSLKNVQAAEKEGITVKELVDRNAKKFYQLKESLNLSFDDFIRTTEKRHIQGCQKLWKSCLKDIYKKKYKGLYCLECEEFYKKEELEHGYCPEHKKKCQLIEEENYFFRLSKYEEKIRKIIEEDRTKIIPEKRKNEILRIIKSGLTDICISRSNERARGWGIDVPGDPSQKIWCWFDALSNYITALGYGEKPKKFEEWWQKNKNKLHIIGKGISRFHCLYWLGILLSAKLALPKTIFIHGYLTVGGEKMSKSLNNVIDPVELVKKYGTDATRYFLLREIPPMEDGDFTEEKFKQRYNADLANGLGNLVARVMTMAEMRSKVKSQRPKPKTQKLINKSWADYHRYLKEFKFNQALAVIWQMITFCDKYIEKEKPWQAKNQKAIGQLLFILKEIAQMLQPFLPETSQKILKQLKNPKKCEPLFRRLT